jgi:hypothetical protein
MVNSLTESVLGVADKVLGKFVADKDLRAKLEHELKTELHRANMAQLEVNKVEAAHKSMFVAGWRPFVGWVCASALAYHFILQPILVFAISVGGIEIVLPDFDMNSLLTILLGLLGLGGMRTLEKVRQVSREK